MRAPVRARVGPAGAFDLADDVADFVAPESVTVESASAIAGIDAIAAPMPSAIANAPTRPTCRAEPETCAIPMAFTPALAVG